MQIKTVDIGVIVDNLGKLKIGTIFVTLLLLAALTIFGSNYSSWLFPDSKFETMSFNATAKMLATEPNTIMQVSLIPGKDKVLISKHSGEQYIVSVPDYPVLIKALQTQQVPFDIIDSKDAPDTMNYLAIGSALLALIGIYVLWQRGSLKRIPLNIMGANTIKPVSSKEYIDCTFDQIAGCDEAIAKLKRVARWLKSPQWYDKFGAKIPKGILAVGPPGTGKTLLARALAGEVEANFFSVNGSTFVEMFVGVGARRVRELFKAARETRKRTGHPSVIFIDELDAVGKKRGLNSSGSDSEREQTLNQLLVSMQGFEQCEGIIVMAATNRADTLDSALTRPGRFDYRVTVDLPDTFGREKIFKIHTAKLKVSKHVNLRALAVRTPLFSGADIEQVCNEAAISAAERLEKKLELENHTIEPTYDDMLLTVKDFDIGIDYVQFGDPLLSRARSQSKEERKNIAYHEAGHSIVQQALQGEGADPITKVTIEPRTKSMGSMQSHSQEDRYGYTEQELKVKIMTAMGGRIAQEYFLDRKDTGAANDFEQANAIALRMVTEFGMSPLGPLYLKSDANGQLVDIGPELKNQIDTEVRKIILSCYTKACEIIQSNRKNIELIANTLLDEQTILADRFGELWQEETAKV